MINKVNFIFYPNSIIIIDINSEDIPIKNNVFIEIILISSSKTKFIPNNIPPYATFLLINPP